jgi:6-phosphogluconolactonase
MIDYLSYLKYSHMRFLLVMLLAASSRLAPAQSFHLFIGTYTNTGSKGIYVYRFDAATGKAVWVSNTDSSANPSFLRISPNGKYVYAVNEISRQQAGRIVAYTFDAVQGQLKLINQQSSGSENPCHLSISKDGKWVAAANYTGGSLSIFPVSPDGSLQPFAQHIVHSGKGVNPQRQEKPHVHSAFFSPDEKYLLTPDLGLDQVSVYRFTRDIKKPLEDNATISTTPGVGPRHLDFSPNGKFLYVLEEMGGAVSVFSYRDGKTVPVQRIFTHPDDYKGQPGSADIHLSPDGKFLYASNRGDENNLAIFSVNQKNGTLRLVGYQSTGGIAPRNFMIDPTGRFLLAANMRSNNIVVFRRNTSTGLLTPLPEQIEIPAPVCLQMYPIR